MVRKATALAVGFGTSLLLPALASASTGGPLPASGFAPALEIIGIRDVQIQLKLHGYDPGPATGTMSEATYRAIIAYQHDYGLRQDGVAGPAVQNALRFIPMRPLPPGPAPIAVAPPAPQAIRPVPAPVALAPPAPPMAPAPSAAPLAILPAEPVPAASAAPANEAAAAPLSPGDPPAPAVDPAPPPATAVIASLPAPVPSSPTASAAPEPPQPPAAETTVVIAPPPGDVAPAEPEPPPSPAAVEPAADGAAPAATPETAPATVAAPVPPPPATEASVAAPTPAEAASSATAAAVSPPPPAPEEAAIAPASPPDGSITMALAARPALGPLDPHPIASPRVPVVAGSITKAHGAAAMPLIPPTPPARDAELARGDEAVRQAQIYLKQLGYYRGDADGVMGWDTVEALVRFDASGTGPREVIADAGRPDSAWLARLKTAIATKQPPTSTAP